MVHHTTNYFYPKNINLLTPSHFLLLLYTFQPPGWIWAHSELFLLLTLKMNSGCGNRWGKMNFPFHTLILWFIFFNSIDLHQSHHSWYINPQPEYGDDSSVALMIARSLDTFRLTIKVQAIYYRYHGRIWFTISRDLFWYWPSMDSLSCSQNIFKSSGKSNMLINPILPLMWVWVKFNLKSYLKDCSCTCTHASHPA